MQTSTKKVTTYCRICEPQCGLIAEIDQEQQRIIKLMPDKQHPVHKGFACHKGLNFIELHHDPDRINFPQIRCNSKAESVAQFEKATWDCALSTAAKKISDLQQKYAPEALGFYFGNPSAFNSTGRDAARKFAAALGAKYMFGSGTQDCSNKFAASEAVFGTVNLHPIPDFKNTHYFLSIGSNPKISHISFVHMTDPMQALRDIVSRGGKVVHINPRNIESATKASGEAVQIKPDTDVYLLAALIHTIKEEGFTDDAWIEDHSTNAAKLWEFISPYSPEVVAPVVGITAEQIREIAHEFANASSACVHMSTGANMGRQGTLAYWLVQMLSLVTGNLGRKGGNIYSPGYFPAATVGKPRQDNPYFASEFGEMRRVAGSLPGNLLAEHIESGLVKGLVCMSGNPILSMGGESKLKQAFAKLELLIVIDIYPNATSLHADIVFPATDWLERPDINSISLGFQPEPYVQYVDAAITPQYERKPEWETFALLLKELGLPNMLDQERPDLLAKVNRHLMNAELSIEQICNAPSNTVRLPNPTPETLFDLGVQLPSGKVDCFPAIIERGTLTCNQQFNEAKQEDEYTLKLITLRTNYMMNSWLHNLPALKRPRALDNPLHVNPKDATRLQLSSGDEVEVSSDFGSIIANVVEDIDLRPGVVAMTHGWGHANNPSLSVANNHPGTNVNALLPSGPGSYDPLSNMSFMTGIRVTLLAT